MLMDTATKSERFPTLEVDEGETIVAPPPRPLPPPPLAPELSGD